MGAHCKVSVFALAGVFALSQGAMSADDEQQELPSDYFGEWMKERLEGDETAFTNIVDNIVSNWISRLDPYDTVGTPEWKYDQETLTVACAACKPLRDATAKVTTLTPASSC